MCDGFSCSRGKILFDQCEIYGKIFSVGRSETQQHSIYERSKSCFCAESEKAYKLKKNEEKSR